MSINFKPAVRFLKNVVNEGVEIGKNITAAAKRHPVVAAAFFGSNALVLATVGLIAIDPNHVGISLPVKIGIDSFFLLSSVLPNDFFGKPLNNAGKYYRSCDKSIAELERLYRLPSNSHKPNIT